MPSCVTLNDSAGHGAAGGTERNGPKPGTSASAQRPAGLVTGLQHDDRVTATLLFCAARPPQPHAGEYTTAQAETVALAAPPAPAVRRLLTTPEPGLPARGVVLATGVMHVPPF